MGLRSLLSVSAAVGLVLVFAAAAEAPRRARTLAEFFSWDDGVVAAARDTADEREVQRLTQECMNRKGFTYIQYTPTVPEIPAADLSPREYAAEFGLGLITQPRGPDVVADNNPNQAVISKLPPTRQASFVDALHGTPTFGPHGGGCSGAANLAVRGRRDELLAPLRAQMEHLGEAIAADPRVAAAEQEWIACLQRAGYVVETRTDLRRLVTREIIEPLQRAEASPSAEFAALRDQERALALALVDCDEPLSEARGAVSAEYEATFIDEHLRELELLRRRAYGGP